MTTDSMPEVNGTRRLKVGEREIVKCACRGFLEGPADPADKQGRTEAVVNHQRTPVHRAFDVEQWRRDISVRGEIVVTLTRVE